MKEQHLSIKMSPCVTNFNTYMSRFCVRIIINGFCVILGKMVQRWPFEIDKGFLPWCLRFWKCSIWINDAMVLFGSLWVIASDWFAVTGESPSFSGSVQPKAISRTQNMLQMDFPTNTTCLSFSDSFFFPISVIFHLDSEFCRCRAGV